MAIDTFWVAEIVATSLDNRLDDAGGVKYRASEDADEVVITSVDLDDGVEQKFRVTITEET